MRTNTRYMNAGDAPPRWKPTSRADHAVNEAHAARFKATVAMWQHADAAGLTPAELHALDMALARGGDPAVLSTTF